MEAFFDSLLSFDLGVFQWIQSIQNPVLTAIMVVITTLGDEGIIFIVMGIAMLCTKKHRKTGFAVLVALVVMLICNNFVLKEILARPRPFNLYELDPVKYAAWGTDYTYPGFVDQPSSFSFPSGHTSSAFAAAIAVLWYDRKFGIPVTIFAALMGFSRIYVQVHYCTDVIGGVVVGIIYALIGVLIAKFLFPYANKLLTKILDPIYAKFKKNKTEA